MTGCEMVLQTLYVGGLRVYCNTCDVEVASYKARVLAASIVLKDMRKHVEGAMKK